MRILDRYLLREFLAPLGYCLSGFLVFWVAFDFFSEMSKLQKLRAVEIVKYYALRAPEFLVLLLPIVLLIALLYALSNHSRHFELTAIRAAGVSLWRLCVPYFLMAAVIGAAVFVLNEFLVPRCGAAAQRMIEAHSDQVIPVDRRRVSNFAFTTREGHMWEIGTYDLHTAMMTNISVNWQQGDGSWLRILSPWGCRSNGVWTFHNANLYHDPTQSTEVSQKIISNTNTLAMPAFTETPEDFRNELKMAPLLSRNHPGTQTGVSIGEILDYLDNHPRLERGGRALLETEVQERLAAPWTCLVVVLIAIPFGAASGRRNVFIGVASAIGICFAFYVLQKLSLALGMNGSVPPWLAAWLPNFAFGVSGTWMTARLR